MKTVRLGDAFKRVGQETTHSWQRPNFYINADNLINRLDYGVEVAEMYHLHIIVSITKKYRELRWQREG